MPTLAAFLQHVLPEASGSIALGFGTGGPDSTKFVSSEEELLRVVPELALSGQDLYYTPARYSVRRRKAANCVAKRCVALDIDLNHEKKPSYTNKEEALVALFQTLLTLECPLPTYVVDSGRGLHAYWALTEDAEPTLWEAAAQEFKTAIKNLDVKLCADTSRWADLAGYLRVPGSLNSKSGTPCMFYEINGVHAGSEVAYPLSALTFDNVVRPAPRGDLPTVLPAKTALPRRDHRSMVPSAPQGESTSIPRPLDLVTECAPLAELAKGDQSYEAWQGLSRLYARAADKDAGREAFHVVSETYKGYSARQTDDKYDDALLTSFASPSCAQMREWAGLDTKACQACPLFQTQGENGKPAALQEEFIDPVQRRNIVPDSLDEEVLMLARARQARLQGTFAPIDTLGVTLPKKLTRPPPEGVTCVYIDEETGHMMAQVELKEGKDIIIQQRRVTRRPFWVDARISERDVTTAGVVYGARVVQVRKKGDDWEARFVTVPAGELNGGAGTFLTALQNYGLDIDAVDPRAAQFRALHGFIRGAVNAIETSRAYHKETKFGWREDDGSAPAFVIGDRRYEAGGTTLLIEQDAGPFDLNEKVEQRGSLNEAKRISALAMEHGLFPLRFLMLCSLGAPLMRMTNIEGALVLVSGETGKGKTAAMSYANSFFGSSKPGKLLANGTDTQKSIMHMIGVVSNLPAFIDETTLMRDWEMADTLLQITQGGENNRLEASSNRLRQRNRWQTIAIASANKDVTEIIKDQSYTAEAQRMRAIDLMTAHMKGEIFYARGSRKFLDEVLVPSHKNHGLIGVDFIKYVLDNYDEVERQVKLTESNLSTTKGILAAVNGDPFRVWRAVVAVAMVAGKLGEQLGYWNMHKTFLDDVLQSLVNAASTLRERATVDSSNYIRDFLYANQNAVVVDVIPAGGGRAQRAALPVGGREVQLEKAKPPSHTPARSSVARLTLTEGSDVATCDLSTMAFTRFCKDNDLELSYVLTKLEQDGILGAEARRQLLKFAPMQSMNSTVSSVGGEVLPATRTVQIQLRLTTPYVMGQPPEYL